MQQREYVITCQREIFIKKCDDLSSAKKETLQSYCMISFLFTQTLKDFIFYISLH
jgi:hypothetical protein